MEVSPPNTSTFRYWYLKLAPTILVFIVASFYFETTEALFVRWIKWDESLSHGLIIIGLFFYFLFLASPLSTTKNSLPGRIFSLSLLGLSSLTWYLANLINLYIIEQLSLLLITAGLFASVFGITVLKQHFKLFLLPVFAIPVWDQLTDPLVNLSGLIVGKMVRLIDLPAVIDSNSIFIPFGEIVIADGCSGLRYLTISLAIAYIISYLNGYSFKKLLTAIVIATAIGLIANWLRIFILVIVGYESQMQSSLMSDHEYFGWALFAMILFPVIYFAPVVKHQSEPVQAPKQKPNLIGAIVLLGLGPALNYFLAVNPSVTELTNKIPHEYNPVPENRMPIKVELPIMDKTENAVTVNQIYVQINQLQRKNNEDKLVPYIPRIYDHVAWSLISQTTTDDNKGFKIQIFRNKHSGIIVAQTQWFDVAGVRTSNYATAKLLQIPAIIAGKNRFTIYTIQKICVAQHCTNETNDILHMGKNLTTIN